MFSLRSSLLCTLRYSGSHPPAEARAGFPRVSLPQWGVCDPSSPAGECHSWEQFLPGACCSGPAPCSPGFNHPSGQQGHSAIQLPSRSPSSSSASNQQLKNPFHFINLGNSITYEIAVRNMIPPVHHSYFTNIETPDLRHFNFCSADKEKGKCLNGYRLQ